MRNGLVATVVYTIGGGVVRYYALAIISVLIVCGCNNVTVKGDSAYVPSVTIGKSKVEITVETICWGADDCMAVFPPEEPYDFKKTDLEAFHVTDSEQEINIEFKTRPKPLTILARIEEIPNYSERGPNLTLPEQKGIYTYNVLVFWAGKKATTQGLANYRFEIIIE